MIVRVRKFGLLGVVVRKGEMQGVEEGSSTMGLSCMLWNMSILKLNMKVTRFGEGVLP